MVEFITPQATGSARVGPSVRRAGRVSTAPAREVSGLASAMQGAARTFSEFYEKDAAIRADYFLARMQAGWGEKYNEMRQQAGAGFSDHALSEFDSFISSQMDEYHETAQKEGFANAPARKDQDIQGAIKKFRARVGDLARQDEALGRASGKVFMASQAQQFRRQVVAQDPGALDAMIEQAPSDRDGLVSAAFRGEAERNPEAVLSRLDESGVDLPDEEKAEIRAQASAALARQQSEARTQARKAQFVASKYASVAIPPDVDVEAPASDPATGRSLREGRMAWRIVDGTEGMSIPDRNAAFDAMISEYTPAPDAAQVQAAMDALQMVVSGSDQEIENINPASFEHGRKMWARGVQKAIKAAQAGEDVLDDVRGLLTAGLDHEENSVAGHVEAVNAIERARREVENRAKGDMPDIAENFGLEVPSFQPAVLPDVLPNILERIAAMDSVRATLDVDAVSDIRPGEAVLMKRLYDDAAPEQQVTFLNDLRSVPIDKRMTIATHMRDADAKLASAIVAGPANPAAVQRGEAVDQEVDYGLVRAISGDLGESYAKDLAASGVPYAQDVAIDGLGDPMMVQARADGIRPEDADFDVSAEQAKILNGAPMPFEVGVPSQADMTANKIRTMPEVTELAGILGYTPDSPEAVEAMDGEIEKFLNVPKEERPEYLATLKGNRRAAALAQLPKPMYFSGEEITEDTLRASAERIMQDYAEGKMTMAEYEREAVKVMDMLEAVNV